MGGTRHGCECLIAGRKCTSCNCLRQCRNKQARLTQEAETGVLGFFTGRNASATTRRGGDEEATQGEEEQGTTTGTEERPTGSPRRTRATIGRPEGQGETTTENGAAVGDGAGATDSDPLQEIEEAIGGIVLNQVNEEGADVDEDEVIQGDINEENPTNGGEEGEAPGEDDGAPLGINDGAEARATAIAPTATGDGEEEGADGNDEVHDEGIRPDGTAEPTEEVEEEENWTPGEGADLPAYQTTPADRLLDSIYGDHAHDNDGCHLDGGIEDDHKWQSRWRRLVQHTPARYVVPRGKVGRRFLQILTEEFSRVRERQWNSERPMVFIGVILQKGDGVVRAKDIRQRMTQRMDLWEQGHYVALVDDTEAGLAARAHPSRRTPDPESIARAFNSKVLSGRLRSAVRGLTSREGGGVMMPDDDCTKTGRPVIDVLRDKHPGLREPLLIGEHNGSFEPMTDEEWKEPIPVGITAEVIEQVATNLSGAAGPDGVDGTDLKNWLLRFGAESEALRIEMATWSEWLTNGHPPWAAYRGLMAGRLVALDKLPGVRPVGIGSIFRRLLAKSLIKVIGQQATAACSNMNLCAGLPSGIEGAVHAVRAVTNPEQIEGEAPLPPEPPSQETEPPEGVDPFHNETPTGTLLVDARNGFNELSRKAMLWTVRSRWAGGAKFAFNCYRHAGQLILRRQGQDCEIILSREGVTQGDPLSMILYGIALLPLTESLQEDEPQVMQPWYADDAAMIGSVEGIARTMRLLEIRGPARGYYPEPAKSIFIPDKLEAAEECKRILEDLNFQHRAGARYLGGFIGSPETQQEWLRPQILQWVKGIELLAMAAKRYPQTAYAGLVKSLQTEWTYLQRVVPEIGEMMKPIEEAITNTFLPALLQEQGPTIEAMRQVLSLSVKKAGLGVPDPTHTANANLEASQKTTASLALALSLKEGTSLNTMTYASEASRIRRKGRSDRIAEEQATWTP